MNGKSVIHVLGSLEELNMSQNCEDSSNIKTFRIDSTNYGLLIYSTNECRISFFKLNLEEFCDITDKSRLNTLMIRNEKELYTLFLLNVFCLSFNLIDVVCANENIWVIGQKTVVDLKPYVAKALKSFKSLEGDGQMDIDDAEEFNHEMFDINIDVYETETNDFHHGDIFVGCSFIDYGFVLCHKNSRLRRWHLKLVILKNRSTLSSDWTTTLFLDFPVSFNKTLSQKEGCDPIIVFIHYNDPERLIFENLFGISCPSSHAICLVGHPEGKLLWSLCDCNNKFLSSAKLQTLLDTKQPIIGVYFFNSVEEFKDSGFMLIMGSLGQITLISSKKHPSFTFTPGSPSFWIRTLYLMSSVSDCVVIKSNLIHFSSDGKLWITELPQLLNSNQIDEEFCQASNSTELSCIQQMTDVSRNHGLLLLKASSGNLYLTVCLKDESDIGSSSLPVLMNECLTQSISMQELLQKRVLQSRLFTALSKFASLKFLENILEEKITFSFSEVNLQPRKYMLVINLQCLENLHLDPELCYVSASVFTHIKSNYSLVSKTVSYDPDEPTLCLELTDTVLQPPFFSVFPLLVEVGLILQLPDKWKAIDCFKTVSNCLPFYLRIQTFMVHEIHMFQSNTLCPPQSFKFDKPKTLQVVKELCMKRPVSNVLKVEPNNDYNYPVKFNLCLAVSSVEEMMKNAGDSDPCEFIEQLLLGDKKCHELKRGTHLVSKKSPLSVTAAKNNSSIVVNVSADSFSSLITLRIATMDILLSHHNQNGCLSNTSAYVNIPATIYRRCEEISKSLRNLYGKDIDSKEVTQSILQLYQELRADVSGKLPLL